MNAHTRVLLGLLVVLPLLSGRAIAADAADPAEALARSKHCFNCHKLAEPGIAPSFRDVARRYKGLENADQVLSREIMDGTTAHWGLNRHWGSGEMPPSPQRVPVNEAEARQLVRWVLSRQR